MPFKRVASRHLVCLEAPTWNVIGGDYVILFVIFLSKRALAPWLVRAFFVAVVATTSLRRFV